MKSINKIIKEWEKATNALAEGFVKKYWGEECIIDMYWIGQEIGDILSIGDYYFDIDRMKKALELNATWEQLNDYYWLEVEGEEKPNVSFKNYVKYGLKDRKQIKNKKQKINIELNCQFGSDFQERSFINSLEMYIEALQSLYITTHRHNKIDVNIKKEKVSK